MSIPNVTQTADVSTKLDKIGVVHDGDFLIKTDCLTTKTICREVGSWSFCPKLFIQCQGAFKHTSKSHQRSHHISIQVTSSRGSGPSDKTWDVCLLNRQIQNLVSLQRFRNTTSNRFATCVFKSQLQSTMRSMVQQNLCSASVKKHQIGILSIWAETNLPRPSSKPRRFYSNNLVVYIRLLYLTIYIYNSVIQLILIIYIYILEYKGYHQLECIKYHQLSICGIIFLSLGWSKLYLFVLIPLDGSILPSRELTYPLPRHFWRWFSFSHGGIC